MLRHGAVTVFVGYVGTTQQHLRGVAAIERNRLPSEVLKRLFAPLHLASLTRVLNGDPAGRGAKPMPRRCLGRNPNLRPLGGKSLAIAIRGELCQGYGLSADEFVAWERDLDRYGIPGLRTTLYQIYRNTEEQKG